MQLPVIGRTEFLEYLEFQFEATGKPAEEAALAHLLNLTSAHPRRTQQLGWACWNDTRPGQPVELDTVITAHDLLVQTIERSEFSAILNLLLSGDDGEVNEVRALQMLADRGGEKLTSRPLVARYGFSSPARIKPTLTRLERRGLINQHGGVWSIVDPFFEEWLRRSSPLADKPT